MKRLLPALIATSLCGLTHAQSPDDLFEALDRELEAEFQATDAELERQFQALDKALKEAFERAEGEVAGKWGQQEAELPSKKRWADYSEDLQARRIIDFEAGEVRIDILADDIEPASLASLLSESAISLRDATQADLSERDLVLGYAKQTLAEQAIPLDTYAPERQNPIVGQVMGAVPDRTDIEAGLTEVAGGGSVAGLDIAPLANGKQKVSLTIPLRLGFESTLASRYRGSVLKESARYDLDPSLLYAIIETESSFNPRARSPVPAFGLMQLVPKSGGMDAYQHVYGEKLLLDPEYLYQPDQNVELGAAYLDVLNSRYLRLITNETSRLLCTIAAYNTGAGNVARAFTGKTNVAEAARIINGMTPEAVYEHLKAHLPYEETRNYIQKVTRAQDKYAPLDARARR